jgi:hypothetical protein
MYTILLSHLGSSSSAQSSIALADTRREKNIFFNGCELFVDGFYMRSTTLTVNGYDGEAIARLKDALESSFSAELLARDPSLCGANTVRTSVQPAAVC